MQKQTFLSGKDMVAYECDNILQTKGNYNMNITVKDMLDLNPDRYQILDIRSKEQMASGYREPSMQTKTIFWKHRDWIRKNSRLFAAAVVGSP